METQSIEDWQPERLIIHVCHELLQDVACASGYTAFLLDAEISQNMTDEQKEFLTEIKLKLDNIWSLNDVLKLWAKDKVNTKISHDDFHQEMQIFNKVVLECTEKRESIKS